MLPWESWEMCIMLKFENLWSKFLRSGEPALSDESLTELMATLTY